MYIYLKILKEATRLILIAMGKARLGIISNPRPKIAAHHKTITSIRHKRIYVVTYQILII